MIVQNLVASVHACPRNAIHSDIPEALAAAYLTGRASQTFDFIGECGRAINVAPGCATTLSMAKPALDLTKLTPEEKLELIDELWTSISPEEFPLTEQQRVELHRRLDRLDDDGPTGVSWDSVRAEMTNQA